MSLAFLHFLGTQWRGDGEGDGHAVPAATAAGDEQQEKGEKQIAYPYP